MSWLKLYIRWFNREMWGSKWLFYAAKNSLGKFSFVWLNSVINSQHVPSPNLSVLLTHKYLVTATLCCLQDELQPPSFLWKSAALSHLHSFLAQELHTMLEFLSKLASMARAALGAAENIHQSTSCIRHYQRAWVCSEALWLQGAPALSSLPH